MSGWGIVVRYDETFAHPNTWMLNAEGDGVWVRCSVGKRPEHILVLRLRWRTPEALDGDAVAVERVSSDRWRIAAIDIFEAAGPCWVDLADTPPQVSEILQRL